MSLLNFFAIYAHCSYSFTYVTLHHFSVSPHHSQFIPFSAFSFRSVIAFTLLYQYWKNFARQIFTFVFYYFHTLTHVKKKLKKEKITRACTTTNIINEWSLIKKKLYVHSSLSWFFLSIFIINSIKFFLFSL